MTTRRVAYKLAGKYVGADPNITEGIYADRDAVGGWEVGELTKRDDGRFVARLEAAHCLVSCTTAQKLERRGWDAIGHWEIARAAEIPPDWPMKLMYDNGLVLDLEYL